MGNLLDLLGSFGDWAWNVFGTLWGWFKTFLGTLRSHFGFIGRWFGDLKGHLQGIWKWAKKIEHTKIWIELHKWYTRYQSWIKWYQVHVLGPIQRVQRILSDVYQIVFGPLIAFGQAVQGVAGVISIFDSKLGEKIDTEIWNIENKLTGPVNWLIAKVSQIEIWFYQILTASGLFDFGTLFNSLSYSINDLRSLLFNGTQGHGVASVFIPPEDPKTIHCQYVDWVTKGTGPLEAPTKKNRAAYQQALADLKGCK